MATVCIPAFNGAQYLSQAIDSVLNQSFKDFELIIVDNNSTDGTGPIVKRYIDERMHYHKNPSTLNMAANWDECLSLSSGKYICLLHADDRLQADYLKVMVDIMENDPEIGFAFSASNIIDRVSHIVSRSIPFPNNYIVPGVYEFQKHILGNYIFCPSVIVRQSAYAKVGSFHGGLRHLLDWDMWLRLEISVGKVAYISQPLVDYRIHDKSATASELYTNTPAEFNEWLSVMIANLSSGILSKKLDRNTFKRLINRVFLRLIIRYFKLSAKYLLFGKIREYILLTKHLFSSILSKNIIRPTLGLVGTVISYVFDRTGYYGYQKKFGRAMVPGEQIQERTP
ncbi:glycosyltransferase [Candidatus Saganbacteria bacterium]|nr:glycosyltransferase [Candidatus Saganbacteria bacterium]